MVIYSKEEKRLIIPEGLGATGTDCEARYREGYREGYRDGLDDCDCSGSTDCSSAVTEAYREGYADGLNANCGEAIDEAYQSGQTAGAAAQKGLLASTAITANGTYTRENGWNSISVNVPTTSGSCNIEANKNFSLTPNTDQWTVIPSAGYDGIGVLTIKDNAGYREQVFTSGYSAGLAACSGGCNLINEVASINAGWGGESYYYPREGTDGFSSFHLYDNGYGQAKYNQGFQSGYTSGYSAGYEAGDANGYDIGYQDGYADGFQSGYTSSPNRAKITFKVPNAAHIVADLSLLSFSVNGVPAEDVGAIFEYDAEQFHTTMWISGYTQPTSITGVVIEIKGENISGNSFNYNWDLFTEINGAVYEAASRSEQYFDIIDDYNKSKRITYTYTGITIYNEYSFEAGKDYGIEVGKPISYKEGMDSVIKSVLAENDTDYVIGYYYTSAETKCLITGEYDDGIDYYDGNACVSAMSINGMAWQPVEKYLILSSGWTQIRFNVCNTVLMGMFSHLFTPSQECYMDALKVVSLPTKIDGLSNTYTFHMNDGLRVIASSCNIIRGATNGADNINVLIDHYKETGSTINIELTNFPQNGVLFIPEGEETNYSNILPNWLHLEMF